MNRTGHMDVELFGKTYTVSVTDDTRAVLEEAIIYLNQKTDSIAEAMGNATPERIAMITALNLAYELALLKKTPNTRWVEEIHNKIIAMQVGINSVLSAQEDLFSVVI